MIRHLLKNIRLLCITELKKSIRPFRRSNLGRYATEVANLADVVDCPKMWKKFARRGPLRVTKRASRGEVGLTTSTPTLAKRIAEEAAARSWESARRTCIRWGQLRKNGTLSTW